MEVIDFLIEHPSIKWTPQEFVDVLAKLQPRLYSISSSLKAHPNQVHFTIDVVKYESRGRQRKGRLLNVSGRTRRRRSGAGFPKHVKVPAAGRWQHANHHGRPGNGNRAVPRFLQERKAIGAKGKNWLFFGSQHQHCNYFYRERTGTISTRRISDPLRLRLVTRSGGQIVRPT